MGELRVIFFEKIVGSSKSFLIEYLYQILPFGLVDDVKKRERMYSRISAQHIPMVAFSIV